MRAKSLLNNLTRAGFRIMVNGDKLRISPKPVPPDLLEAVKAHKPELMAILCGEGDRLHMAGYPIGDGPYTPYVVPMTPERAIGLVADLRTTINRLGDLEGWTDERRAHLLGVVGGQPLTTLADDLAYFQEHLARVEAVVRVVEIGRCAVARHDAIRKCATCEHRTFHDSGVPVRCAHSRTLGVEHRSWLDTPDALNPCREHTPKQGES